MSRKEFMQINKINCPDGHYGTISDNTDLICPYCGVEFKSAYHRFAPKKRVFMFR